MKKLTIAIVAGFMSLAVAGAYAVDEMKKDKMDKMDKSKGDMMKSDKAMDKSKSGMMKEEKMGKMDKMDKSKKKKDETK